MAPNFSPLPDFDSFGKRQWQRFMVESLAHGGYRLHRCACRRGERPGSEIGRFSTFKTALRIARFDTGAAVELCPHCIGPKRV